MKRICIYVTYDFENIVDGYIGYMLQELRKSVDYLAVVCNYREIAKGIGNIRPYADKIYYRENIGFDAGAYKDVLCRYIGWDAVCRYNEILLVNDSFYGPLYSFENIFSAMEKEDADYWGLTRAPAGVLADGFVYESHIQSYFMAFRQNLVKSQYFQKFWENMEYAKTLTQTVIHFEIGLNQYLAGLGYKSRALTDGYSFDRNEIPYMNHSFELINDMRIPAFKRTSLYLTNRGFGNALKAFSYIEDAGIYDAALIKEHLIRISRNENNQAMIDFMKLKAFLDDHSRIYFYGAGVYGQNLAKLFEYMGWKFAGFLVSKSEDQADQCNVFNAIKLNREDGIIITVGSKKAFNEIMENVKEQYADEQILCPITYRVCK